MSLHPVKRSTAPLVTPQLTALHAVHAVDGVHLVDPVLGPAVRIALTPTTFTIDGPRLSESRLGIAVRLRDDVDVHIQMRHGVLMPRTAHGAAALTALCALRDTVQLVADATGFLPAVGQDPREIEVRIDSEREPQAHFSDTSLAIETGMLLVGDVVQMRLSASRQIMSHEATHALSEALLDAARSGVSHQFFHRQDDATFRFRTVSEGIADAGAILVGLRTPALVRHALAQTGGDLRKANVITALAPQLEAYRAPELGPRSAVDARPYQEQLPDSYGSLAIKPDYHRAGVPLMATSYALALLADSHVRNGRGTPNPASLNRATTQTARLVLRAWMRGTTTPYAWANAVVHEAAAQRSPLLPARAVHAVVQRWFPHVDALPC